jgi:hypothetical protein
MLLRRYRPSKNFGTVKNNNTKYCKIYATTVLSPDGEGQITLRILYFQYPCPYAVSISVNAQMLQ